MVQKSFFKNKSEHSSARIAHGGSTSQGRRKLYRPLNPRKPLHIAMKSSHAKGRLSLLGVHNRLRVDSIVKKQAAKFQVTVQAFENMGNHLHLVVVFKTRKGIQAFLRAIGGMISRLATGARKGKAFGKRFWDDLAFTRIVTGRKDSWSMVKYLEKNKIERENGPSMRSAVELNERITREARRRRMSRDQVIQEMMAEFTASN